MQSEEWDSPKPDPDAETFLKLDGRRWGRDLELYVSVIELIGPRGVAATLLEEIILPLKEISPEAYTKGIEVIRDFDVGEDPAVWHEMIDSLDHIKLDDYFYPVDQQRLDRSLFKNERFAKISKGGFMHYEGKVARVTQIVAESTESFEDAIMTGFKRASKTLRGITGLGSRNNMRMWLTAPS